MNSYLQKRYKLDNRNNQITFINICAICSFYTFSHPYPQVISILEISIGLFLGIAFLFTLLFVEKSTRAILLVGLLSTMFFWPLLVGLIKGSSLGNIIRDVIPFLYICFASIFLIRSDTHGSFFKAIHRVLPWLLTLIGLVFTVREVLPFLDHILANNGIVWLEMHLLLQSCAVTFAMCFLLLRGCNFMHSGNYFKGIILLALSLIPFIGAYLSVMRAPTAFYILFILIAFIIWPVKIWRKVAIVGVVGLIFIISMGPNALNPYLANLTNKQKNHGNNGKIEEVTRITELTLDGTKLTQLFGQGWGSTWASPAFQPIEHPGKRISYAHSFIAYSILKFGIPGYLISILLIVMVFSLFSLAWYRVKVFSYEGTVLLSTMPALLIGIFLEPNYKTLDFSLTLLILIIAFKVANSKSVNTTIELK
ncbi:O-antigen ligase like membrane protein [Zobellia nedashkovskayae]